MKNLFKAFGIFILVAIVASIVAFVIAFPFKSNMLVYNYIMQTDEYHLLGTEKVKQRIGRQMIRRTIRQLRTLS